MACFFMVLFIFLQGYPIYGFSQVDDAKESILIEDEMKEIENDENLKEEQLLEQETEQEQVIQEEPQEELKEEKVEENNVIEVFQTQLSNQIIKNLKYNNYATSYDYILALSKGVKIFEQPSTQSKVVHNISYFERMGLIEKVNGDNEQWYKVYWWKDSMIQYGYISASLVEPRSFQFEKMEKAINALKEEIKSQKIAYISNYKNKNGKGPLWAGKESDYYGKKRDQAAPAYLKPSIHSDFRYIEDGGLVRVWGEQNGFYQITTLNFEGIYWVPKKYISFQNHIKDLKKVVVVDRKNQNEGVFEYVDGKWQLVSYTLATTGDRGKYKQQTPLGYFMAIEKRPRFLYLHDGNNEVDGYAPYAIRFSGGVYIHGVPTAYKVVEGKQIDPGMREYLWTIGTIPKSHGCVRNYTSHAKFLYDWLQIGESAVVVIE